MATKKKFEAELAALDDRRKDPASAVPALRKALGNRNNYYVSKAARIVGEAGIRELIPDLLVAFERFFVSVPESDPQCWAKNAITDALSTLGHDDAETYLRGLQHIQMEPVWGGREDTAGQLRCKCLAAIIQCRGLSDHDLLTHMLDRLHDGDKTVRAEAARAMSHIDRRETAMLLRLRALAGDEELEVVGACLAGVLAIEQHAACGFVSRFLSRDDETAGEAAMALAQLHSTEAFELIRARFERELDSSLASVLLTGIALTRTEEGTDYLIGMVDEDAPRAAHAIAALSSAGASEDTRLRLQRAVANSGNDELMNAYRRAFR